MRSDCPIANALDLWGDKWSLLIVRDMLFERKQHYGEFLQSGEGISTNILAERLARLEQAGMLQKQRDSSNKTRFVYSLTQKGIDLLPILVETAVWSLHHNPQMHLAPEIVAAIQADKAGFIQSIRNAFQK